MYVRYDEHELPWMDTVLRYRSVDLRALLEVCRREATSCLNLETFVSSLVLRKARQIPIPDAQICHLTRCEFERKRSWSTAYCILSATAARAVNSEYTILSITPTQSCRASTSLIEGGKLML